MEIFRRGRVGLLDPATDNLPKESSARKRFQRNNTIPQLPLTREARLGIFAGMVPFGDQKGNTVRPSPQEGVGRCRGCPRTVSGEPRANHATGQLGRRRKATIREPGDLPSFVVTHERIGRGEPMEASNRLSYGSVSGFWLVVTCHVTARPQPCPFHPHFLQVAKRSSCLPFCSPVPFRPRQRKAPRGPFHCLRWSSRQPACR